MDINIGTKLKDLRIKSNLSIKQLSEISNVSTGLISQAERNMVTPSVENLWKLSQALNVNVSYFFVEQNSNENMVVRKSERRRLQFNEGAAIYEQLTPNIEKTVEMFMLTVKANSASALDCISHEGVDVGVILSGSLDVLINGCIHKLEEGDSIYYNSSLPHKFFNNNDVDCISIWAITPPTF